MDKPPLPPIRPHQDQVVQASNHFYRSDSPQPFIGNNSRPKTGHPSNNTTDGSPSGATRRRLPKIAGASTLPPGAPPLYIGSTSTHPTLPKVGEEDSLEIGSFPEEIPASILEQTSNVDTLDDAVVAIINSEEDAHAADEDLDSKNEPEYPTLQENNEFGENENEETNCDEEEGDNISLQEEIQRVEPLEESEDKNSEANISQDNIETNDSNAIEKEETADANDSNLNLEIEDNSDNITKPDDDRASTRSNVDECDGEESQMPNDSPKEDQVPIEEDDDNDVMSPNEVSREASAQSGRAGVLSPLNVTPKPSSRVASASLMSPKPQNSRSASRLSSNRSPRSPSATLNPNTYNTYTSPSKSPALASPKMGSSSSRKCSAQVSRVSSRLEAVKLGKLFYIVIHLLLQTTCNGT